MTDDAAARSPNQGALGKVLDEINSAARDGDPTIGDMVEAIGSHSFAALMLVFALIAVSPATIIPGVTTTVAFIEAILVVQMIAGRRHLWLPSLLSKRTIQAATLQKGLEWLRRPVRFVDKLLRPRLGVLLDYPWFYPWLFTVLAVTLVMPFMEIIPGTGTVAASFIALVAAALLTRDGFVLLAAGAVIVGLIYLLGWFATLF